MPRLIKYNTNALSADATLDSRDMYVDGLFVAKTGCATITIPAPDYDAFLNGQPFRILNDTATAVSAACTNGFAQAGDSVSIASGECVEFECVDDGTGAYIWATVGVSAATSTEVTQDVVGAMFTGNTETGVTVTYQDADGTVDVELVDEYIADLAGGMWTGNTLTGLTVTYQDADNTIDAAVTYGTTAATACVGNDARLLTTGEHTALAGSINWQDWAPTIASVPATDSLVARYQRIGNSVRGYIDVRGSDGDGWTPSTITLPVAPSDVNARIPIQARQKVNAAAATDMEGYIDAETDLRIEFEGAAACTDTQAWHLYIWFEYEVAA